MKTRQNFFSLQVGFIIICLLISNVIFAQNNPQTFKFDKNKLRIGKVSDYDMIRYENLENSTKVGAPQVPVQIIHLPLPPSQKISRISTKIINSQYLDGEYELYPAQPPQILSGQQNKFTPPDPAIYDSADLYPKENVQIAPLGYFSGNGIGSLFIYPVQYLPAEKKVLFISELEVELILETNDNFPKVVRRSEYSELIRDKSLKRLIGSEQYLRQTFHKSNVIKSTSIDDEHVYVIITSSNLTSSFQPLADWKLKKGLSAKIVTTSHIYSNYSGIDSQEKIRNFIIDAYQNWGTVWILLGGDTNIIPHRSAFAFDCEYGDYSNNYIPCDLYYSDLDGNWNANGNNIYGEIDDSIDMYPDVFVGRAPVENSNEAQAFVNKILTYEKSAPNGHELNMLFLADVLWTNPYTNSGDGKDLIDSLFVPNRFDPITKLYHALGNESKESAVAALNIGQNIVNHDGHAWYSSMGVGDGSLQISDMDGLSNNSKYSILFSIGCWPAAIDYDCIAEHFVTNPNGGGVAFIGNSRYGWGSPGNAVYGYSDRFDQQFFKYLFQEDVTQVGQTISMAKSFYVPYSAQENVYRWCEYQVNLLGDPEMPIWTDTPKTLIVDNPTEISVGESFCSINVTDGSLPVSEALVCLMQENSVYETGITGIDGSVDFEISITDPSKEIHLTITAQNFIPFEKTISLVSGEPFVQISAYTTNGSRQGFVMPGELIPIDCCFKNFGEKVAGDVNIILRNGSTKIVLVDSSESVGTIQPGDSIWVYSAFSLQTGTDLNNGEVIHLKSSISDSLGNSWTDLIGITGATPLINYDHYQISDSLAGDGDNYAEAGESINLKLLIQNTGLTSAQNVTLNLTSNSQHLNFINSNQNIGNISSDSSKNIAFEINIDTNCPEPLFPQVVAQFSTDDGYQFSDSFFVSIGEFGLQDNMENGATNWTHSGNPDYWHLSTNRKNSGTFSWYCGKSETFEYDNNMDNSLESKSFILDQNSQLSFWCWFLSPNYGVNGINPQINDGSGWKKLDFIGSGGALGMLPTGNDWLKYTYDLSHYPAGTSLKVRFRFVSDDEVVTEGAYIDDVIVQNKNREMTYTAPPIPQAPQLICSEENNKFKLTWTDNTGEIENFDQAGYSFQGYNVYQLYSPKAIIPNGVCIATFDISDGVTEIVENIIDPKTGLPTQRTIQNGTDSGIKRSFEIDLDYLDNYQLIKGRTYYFAITAYTYNPDQQALPKCSESLMTLVEIIFQKDQPGFAYGDTIRSTQMTGAGNGIVSPIIYDPSVLTGHDYQVNFSSIAGGTTVWNLKDLTTNTVLLSQQSFFRENEICPIVDGLKIIVQDVEQLDFSDLAINGNGNYSISSYYYHDWATTARAIDIWGRGTKDKTELGKDYELRFTGEYENPNAGTIYIKDGTGSIATIYGARSYSLRNHPMNPNPTLSDPFTIRIPFEIWNVDDKRQVNILVYDRSQDPFNSPFYAFNPNDRMYCYILNTPYKETVVDFNGQELDNLTWNLVFWETKFQKGDKINIFYDNSITTDDVFAFTADTNLSAGDNTVPQDFELYQNFPNPFKQLTTFRFYLQKQLKVTLKVYNLLGEEITTLSKSPWTAGKHEIIWDAKSLPSGIYLYHLKAENFSKTKKFILLK